jgi:hypothetical protein
VIDSRRLSVTSLLVLVCLLGAGTCAPPASAGVTHLTSSGVQVIDASRVATAIVRPDPAQTVLAYIGTFSSGGAAAPIPKLSGGGVTWTRVGMVPSAPDAPRRLTLFSAKGVAPGALTISFPVVSRVWVGWSIVQAPGAVRQVGTAYAAGPPASVAVPSAPRGVVIAGFMVGTNSIVQALVPATKLGEGHTPSLATSTSTDSSRAATVSSTWVDDGPGHFGGIAVEMA